MSSVDKLELLNRCRYLLGNYQDLPFREELKNLVKGKSNNIDYAAIEKLVCEVEDGLVARGDVKFLLTKTFRKIDELQQELQRQQDIIQEIAYLVGGITNG